MRQRPHEWNLEATGVVRFQIVWLRERYHWELFNPGGTPVARSAATYPTEVAATEAAKQARANIGNAPIVPSA